MGFPAQKNNIFDRVSIVTEPLYIRFLSINIEWFSQKAKTHLLSVCQRPQKQFILHRLIWCPYYQMYHDTIHTKTFKIFSPGLIE